jgi:Fe-S-cluster containining protein
MSDAPSHKKWYAEGLHFQCQGCGDCCRGPGGYVWVTEEEAETIAKDLNMDFQDFAQVMLRRTISGLALVDDRKGDCPLLGEGGRCRVYHHRPLQCRTWPWWAENLVSRERWDDAATRCPGMNKGPVHSQTVIDCEKAKDF